MVRQFGQSNVGLEEAEALLRSQLGIPDAVFDSRQVFESWTALVAQKDQIGSEKDRVRCINQFAQIFSDLANQSNEEASFNIF